MTLMAERPRQRHDTRPAPRLLRAAGTLEEHRAAYGDLPLRAYAGETGQRRLIDAVHRAGLRGRGGGGYPTGRKLAAVAEAGRTPVVVANGCESEPASSKDRALLSYAPHLVLDGAVLAAHAVGADRVVLCVERGAGLADRLEREIARRRTDPVRWEVARLPRRYVASESSALVKYINTGDARPTFAPPRTADRGVAGRPTLVDNVETLAHLALIALHGAEWFRAVGTDTDPGSTLVTIGGAVHRPGVYEIAPGTRLGAVLDLAGGPTETLGAALVGGYFGTWVPLPGNELLPLSHDPAGTLGVTVGAGAIVALPATGCGLVETARVARYLAEESAGQCGPCVFGLPAIADDMEAVGYGRCSPAVRQRLTRRLAMVNGRGACSHPDGATRLVNSALSAFAADLQTHLGGATCRGAAADPLLPLPAARDRDGSWR
ncbi:NADH-ubiquinone oxidoreductase-F iron-sulfur binding region domain-containing protein [Catenuloplanes niger JCM 9533]|uniref:NADH:ubiquinone oxidoreductase subunit F (NADH-binding) n=2 Tax=Micromonosporaceae TaxID=28056 RepID=A0AAE3ZTR6_9ACTN|nr:NADH:ubiquinone oxidoreductase subunit F (NADH-binding) [Catenuloplanes niger]